MGSARVQYELERTLPSLQLTVEHGIFDKETEIRSITHKRRQFESSLVRRHALSDDFHNYLDYEEELEKLLKIRLKRIQATEDIPRSDIHKIQHDFTRHLISIFERSVKRLRSDFSLWQRYINWAKQRNMRGAISRISARALSLFPNNVQLWLSVANHELNINLNPSTARALLQRGLRLNGVVHRHAALASTSQRTNKRSKLNNGQSLSAPLAIRPAGDKIEDTPTFNIAEKEQAALQIWLEYIRMELVFLERIRRRKIALNILDNHRATKEVNEENKRSENEEDDEVEAAVPASVDDEPASDSIAEIAKAEKQTQEESSEAQPEADLIVLGAIPITAMKSALSLDSIVSLPPLTHFGLLTSLTGMVDEFPFYGDATELRKRLHKAIEDALRNRFGNHPTAILYQSSLPMLHSSSKTGMEDLGEVELKEELESSSLLRRASRLSPSSDIEHIKRSVQGHRDFGVRTTTNESVEETTFTAQATVLNKLEEALKRLQSNIEVASLIRVTLENLRKWVLALGKPQDGHISVQLRLIQSLRRLAEDIQLGEDFDAYLVAYSKRILQDAKKLGCSGKETQYARMQGQLVGNSLKTQEEYETFITKAIESCLQYDKDHRFIHLASDAVLKGSQNDTIFSAEGKKVWRKILRTAKGTDDVELWQKWCESLSDVEERKEVQRAIVQDTVGEQKVQQALLMRLYDTRRDLKDGNEIINWVKVHGLVQPSFLRYVVKKEETESNIERETMDRYQMKIQNPDLFFLLKSTYNILIDATHSTTDIISYLKFLCIGADAQQEAVELFNRTSKQMGRTDADGLVKLERGWKDILNIIRRRDADEEEEEESDGSDD